MPDTTTGPRAVFLSYAREDSDAVRRIAEALRAFGVEVWFDQNELRGGDAWDGLIKKQIRECALFVPVVSARTQERGEGYFRREWNLGVERTRDMAHGLAFIVPVVIDETPESDALVPEEFMRVQWTRLPHGVPSPDFVTQIKSLLESPRKNIGRDARVSPPAASVGTDGGRGLPGLRSLGEVGRTPVGPARGLSSVERPPFGAEAGYGDPALQKQQKRFPVWVVGAVAAVAIGVVAAVMVSRKAEPATGPAQPATSGSDLLATRSSPPATLLAAAAATDKSIAVLPFANMSEEQEASAFFSDGIHEDILTNLALIRELRVVSRTSVMGYRGTTKPMKQIAAELGVAYILEGSVRRAGNKVRVTGQLIHAATDDHVWAKAYDRDLTDIFTIQSELSQQIAAALKTALSPEEEGLIARRPTSNPVAYDVYLRARDVSNREGNSSASKARQIELLQQAVELDPSFAQAWGDLAAICAFSYFSNEEGMDELLARATRAIEQAKRLAPGSPETIDAVGTYLYYGFRDYVGANEQFERLARLQPNSPVVFNSLALIQRRQGRWAQSLVNSRRATELDPSNVAYLRSLWATLRAGRRWAESQVVIRRIAALLPGSLNESFLVAVTGFQANGAAEELDAYFAGLSPERRNSPRGVKLRKDAAIATGDAAGFIRLDRAQPYFDEDGGPHWLQACDAAAVYFTAGDVAGARARLGDFPAEIRELVAREPKNAQGWIYLAQAELILGNPDAARRALERNAAVMPESRDALDGANWAAFRAVLQDWLGDKERALAEYTRLLQVPAPFGLNVHIMKRTHSTLHGDPRFEALLNDPKNNAPLF